MRPLMTGAAAGGGHLMEKQSSSSLVPTAEELWKAWEIHCSILLSLFLQVFLFLFADLRQRSSKRFLSNFLWLAYLSADAVAMFVLGHLAVRVSRDEPGHELMSLWAPFVLVHLGGQDTISAFAKQDNELWKRHLLNLAIQAAVAGYVVAKTSWPDRRLRAAVALIFVSGFIKYAERTAMLHLADPARLKMKAKRKFFWEMVRQKLFSRGNKKKKAEEEEEQQQQTTTKAGKESREKTIEMMMLRGSAVPQRQLFLQGLWKLEDDIIAVDAPRNLSVPAADQEDVLAGLLEGFLSREDRLDNAYGYVGALLGHSYRRLYTKDLFRELCTRLIIERRGDGMLLFSSFTPFVSTSIALALFVAAEKQQQATANSRVDIIVSYSLLVGALALDVSSAATFIFFHLSSHLRPAVLDRLPSCIQPSWRSSKKHWSQKLGQYNMVRSARMGSPCRFLGCDVKHTSIAKDGVTPIIKKFILDTLLASGAEKKWAIASTRGRRALNRRSLHDEPSSSSATAATTLTALKETITSGADLPTSVLILHIATDICYYHGDQEEQVEHKQISRQLSDYIMYLVFKCGVMFAFNSQVLHDKALEEIEKILSRPHGEKAAVMKVFEQDSSKYQVQAERHKDSEEQQATDSTTEEIEDRGMQDAVVYNDLNRNHMKKLHKNSKTLESPVLPRAREVAKELLSINNEAARWKLIVEVWAEMLYYVAPRCGGGFHYDRLSKGGEFVTHVLVLMYYLGPFMPPPDA